jgi:hypothetical protein
MNVSQALNNFFFLKHLNPTYKLITDGVRFSYDNRWLPSVRRTVTGNSRRDLLKPIEQTFVLLREIINPLEELNVLKHIQEVFHSMYPDYQPIHSLIARLIENSSLRTQPTDENDVDESAIESISNSDTTSDDDVEDFNMSTATQSATITSSTLPGDTRGTDDIAKNPLHTKRLPGTTPDRREVFEPPTDEDDSWVTSSVGWCCAGLRLRKKVKNI